MLKPQILSGEAIWPYNTYDSTLEIPNGNDPNQNAWLTLQLRVHLKFVDSRHPHPPLTFYQDGKWYAQDSNGYLFPLIDWRPHLIQRFLKEYAELAEKTWNWQFVLITPKNYSDLDYRCLKTGVTVRPNVLCLFRMSMMSETGEALDTSPRAGPMRAGPPHRTINVVNLNYAAGTVHLAPGVVATADLPATKHPGQIDGLSFRSNDMNYDDADLFRPAMWQQDHNIWHNTWVMRWDMRSANATSWGSRAIRSMRLGAPTRTLGQRMASARRTRWTRGTSWVAAIASTS